MKGEVGTSVDVTFDGQVSVDEIEKQTLVTGEGEKVAKGDQVLVHLLCRAFDAAEHNNGSGR